MRRWLGLVVVGLAAMVGWTALMPGCRQEGGGGKPTVVATIFCYYDAVRAIGGDRIRPVLLLPRGTSPHDYDPPFQAKVDVSDAILIVRNGLGIDPWLDKLASDSKATIIDVSREAEVLHTAEMGLDEGPKGGARGGEGPGLPPGATARAAAPHEHAFGNPHIWLDPHVQMAAAGRIRECLIKLDPANAETYRGNAEKYLGELRQLDEDFVAAAKTFARKDFIGFHSAYDYLSHRYGLRQVAAIEEVPGTGLTPAQADKIIQIIKREHIPVIFMETAPDCAVGGADYPGNQCQDCHPTTIRDV